MPKCPNCGQETTRTEDWACQWCGYPLLSLSYKKTPKTHKQLKDHTGRIASSNDIKAQIEKKRKKVLGAFPIRENHWLKLNIYYMFFFTSDSLVAVKTGTQNVLDELERVPDSVFIPSWLADMEAKLSLDSQSVLATDKHNFEIPYSDISEVKMKKSWFGFFGWREGKITIFMPEKKLQFDIASLIPSQLSLAQLELNYPLGWKFSDCINIVRSVLPNILQG